MMDPDSITIDKTGSDSVVLENDGEDSEDATAGITIVGDGTSDESADDGIVFNPWGDGTNDIDMCYD